MPKEKSQESRQEVKKRPGGFPPSQCSAKPEDYADIPPAESTQSKKEDDNA